MFFGFPRWHSIRIYLANGGDTRDRVSILRSERFPGGGNGNPLQSSCPEKAPDRGAWQAAVPGVTDGDD